MYLEISQNSQEKTCAKVSFLTKLEASGLAYVNNSICDALRDLVPVVKKCENIHGGVILLIKLQASTCIFSKSNAPPLVFFTFFKL